MFALAATGAGGGDGVLLQAADERGLLCFLCVDGMCVLEGQTEGLEERRPRQSSTIGHAQAAADASSITHKHKHHHLDR